MMLYAEQAFVPIEQPFALTVGKFDGLHLGHGAIFQALRQCAPNLVRVGYLLQAPGGGKRLQSAGQQLQLAAQMGLHRAVQATIEGPFAALEAEAFVQRLCQSGPMQTLVVGENFRFGRGAAGDVRLLQQLGGRYGFATVVVPPVLYGDVPISSTRIRAAVQAGDMDLCRAMLGRAYQLQGYVQGHVFLPDDAQLLPAAGKYPVLVGKAVATLQVTAQGLCTLAEDLAAGAANIEFL